MRTNFKIDGYRTLITGDRLLALLRCAEIVPKGLWAECGVYKGGSLKCLSDNFPEQNIIGFDTFSGLPSQHWKESEVHAAGEFNIELREVGHYLSQNPGVSLVPGLFPETAEPFSDDKFSFVHVDFDFELGIEAAIDFFWPRMVGGGIMIFDDWTWPNCPGVAKALDRYKVIPTANFQCAIIK